MVMNWWFKKSTFSCSWYSIGTKKRERKKEVWIREPICLNHRDVVSEMCLEYFFAWSCALCLYSPSLWERYKTDMRVCIHLLNNIVIAWVVLAGPSWTHTHHLGPLHLTIILKHNHLYEQTCAASISSYYPNASPQINTHIGSVSHITMMTDRREPSPNKTLQQSW